MTALCCSSYGFCDSLTPSLGSFWVVPSIFLPRVLKPAANYTLSKVFAGALDFIVVINKVARFQNEVKSVHRANGSSMLSGGN